MRLMGLIKQEIELKGVDKRERKKRKGDRSNLVWRFKLRSCGTESTIALGKKSQKKKEERRGKKERKERKEP